MELSEMHVGQTVFVCGNRDNWWVITGKGEDAMLAKFHGNGLERGWQPYDFEPIPSDLHDKDGNPLKMGDKFKVMYEEHTVCGAHISGTFVGAISIEKDSNRNNGFAEFQVTKVEPVETVDDVRRDVDAIVWSDFNLNARLTVQFIIDRTEKAVRAEYER